MERKQGTHTVHPIFRNFFFFCFVLFIFIGKVRTEDTNNENLSGCKFLCHRSSCNSSSTDGNDRKIKIWRRQPHNALLETQETITDSVFLPVEYNPQGDFVVKLGLGTPPQTRTFSLSTILDVSWTFCEPCPVCNKQDNQLFDASKSSTYRKVSCTSPSCTSGCFDESSCLYHYEDGDFRNITGLLNTDVLSLNQNNIRGFVFGCGTSNNSPNEYTQGLDGYLGFGTGPQSFLSMTANKYNNAFSYCLPLDRNTPGFLSLGGHAVFSKSAQFVPFSKVAPFKTTVALTNYVLDLVGISVDGESLPIGLSASKSNSLPILLDSGTGVTRFPEEIYKVLRDNFRKLMSKYPMLSETPSPIFDTCYDLSGVSVNVSVPAIDLTFSNGVDIPLASWGVLYQVSSRVSCFAFSVNGGKYAIFGTTQQKAFKIIYDNSNKRIGFDKDACSAQLPLNPVVVSAAFECPLASFATIAAMSLAVWLNGNMI